MAVTKSTQQAIEEFVEVIAHYYLDVKSREEESGQGTVAEEFVSAIETDLRSTLRDRLSQLETARHNAEAPTATWSAGQLEAGDEESNAASEGVPRSGPADLGPTIDTAAATRQRPLEAIDPLLPTAEFVADALDQPGGPKVAAGGAARSTGFSFDNDVTVDTGSEMAAGRSAPPDAPDGYEILSVLGRGGMGVVYKARHIPLNRLVAVKMILSAGTASEDQLNRFQREAEAAAHLKHPNIVSVYEVGLHRGLPYFSLEYVEGESLSDLTSESTMSAREAARLLIPVARAVEYSHRMGVLHRDLKPQNILMTEEGEPKVADFGLAKRIDTDDDDTEKTREGVVLGTPGYMAPEQVRNTDRVGPHSDVYALGCILYYLITGRPPFTSPTPFETVRQSLLNDPLAPSKLQANVDRDLETICLKSLEKEIDKRYASAADFADELQRFVDGVPIVARPITRHERMWKWCKRNPRTATLSAITSLLLFCLLVGGLVSSVVINEQKKAEQVAREEAETNEQRAREQGELAAETTRLLLYQTKDFFDENPQLRPLREPLMRLVVDGADRIYTEHEKYNVNDVFTASADLQLGEIYLQAGAFEKAVEQLTKAESQIEALRDNSDVSNVDISEMKVALALGDAHRYLGNMKQAEEQYLRLERLREDYFRKRPEFGEQSKQASLAEVYGRLATTYRLLGNPQDNLRYNLLTVKIRREAADANPGDQNSLAELAGALTQLSASYENSGKIESMLAASSEALAIQMKLAESKSDLATRHNTAKDQKVVARQYLLLGKNQEARELLDDATSTLDELLELSDDQRVQNQAIDAYFYQGLALDRLGEDARGVYDRAETLQREMLEKSNNVNARGSLLKILARAGKVDEAIALAEKLAAKPDEMYHCGYAACGFALISGSLPDDDPRKAEIIEKAIELTRRLIRHGYHDFESLRSNDLDFEPIQSEEAFQQMIDEEETRVQNKSASVVLGH